MNALGFTTTGIRIVRGLDIWMSTEDQNDILFEAPQKRSKYYIRSRSAKPINPEESTAGDFFDSFFGHEK